MLLLIGIISLLFVCISFFLQPSGQAFQNSFEAYYNSQLHVIQNHSLFFIVFFIVLVVYIYSYLRFENDFGFLRKLFTSLLQVTGIILTGFFTAYAFLLFVAFIELNIYSILLNSNPSLIGVTDDRSTIIAILKTASQPPNIVASDIDSYTALVAIAKTSIGTDNFYAKYILSTIPNAIVLPVHRPAASMLYVANTLIITKINPEDLQDISPYIGYLFVKQYFPDRKIKSYPKISIMDRQEYLVYRKEDAKKRLQQIDTDIVKIQSFISSSSAQMADTKNSISSNETITNQTLQQRNRQFKICLSQGGNQTSCTTAVSQYDDKINQENKSVSDWNSTLLNQQNELQNYQYYLEFLKNQEKILVQSAENVPHELGVFEPKSSIRIVIDTTNAHAIADYFATLTHEYLHYASFVSNDQRFASPFFEEGLTEYFTRQTIQNDLHTSTNLGYPVYAKIITEMMKMFTESEFADIYFSKDEQGLEDALNRDYGDNFYTTYGVVFDSLQYASTPEQMVKLANTIMKKIGGNPLTIKDLQSTHSSL